jgi:arginyl-tRNA synthetase
LKKEIENLVQESIQSSKILEKIELGAVEIEINRTKSPKYGEYSCNVALQLAKILGLSPIKIADEIIKNMEKTGEIKKTIVAPPGFINFYLSESKKNEVIRTILEHKKDYGTARNTHTKILLEFVSSNPTGPLHIGHGRHAAYGDSLANLLRKAGNNVRTEYYINDAGRQIDILVISVLIKLLKNKGIWLKQPIISYQGAYIEDIAQQIYALFKTNIQSLLDNGVFNKTYLTKTKDEEVDLIINDFKKHLGTDLFSTLSNAVTEIVVKNIKNDLKNFGVIFDNWFSEKEMINKGQIKQSISVLKDKKYVYKDGGALWFKTSKFNDDKDRVVLREDGSSTYFASDVAYHLDKRNRGFDLLLNVLGSDHHGYVPRLKAGLEAMDHPAESLEAILIQFVSLFRGNKKIQMSTRAGDFVPLVELLEEVGKDAARFFYVSRSNDQHLNFDLDLAKAQNNDNPVYYIQYAHARIYKVFQELSRNDIDFDKNSGISNLGLLSTNHETQIITKLGDYPNVIELSAGNYSVHSLANYLLEIAQFFHSYYNAHRFIVADNEIRNARLALIAAVAIVIKDGLSILGVSAPEQM